MRRIRIGHPEAHEKLTCRLLYRLPGDPGFRDVGTVQGHKDTTVRATVTRPEARRGYRNVTDEQTDRNHESYTFSLSEMVEAQERILRLASTALVASQDGAEGATASVGPVQRGLWYEVGAYGLRNLRVWASATGALSEGEDFEADSRNGMVRVLPGGRVAPGEYLLLEFDQPGAQFEASQTRRTPCFKCRVVVEERNGFDPLFLRRLEFDAMLNATQFPRQAGDFATWELKVTPTSRVHVMKREQASSLASFQPGPADESSSESTPSSASSQSSSSSSSPSSPSSSSSSSSSPSSQSSSSSSPSSQSSLGTSSSSSQSSLGVTSSSSESSSSSSPSSLSSSSSSSPSSESSSSSSPGSDTSSQSSTGSMSSRSSSSQAPPG